MKTIAVIGCGRIANLGHLPALKEMKNVRVKYACDILLEKGKENKMEKTIKVEKELSSPIKKGEKVGEIVYSIDGETVSSFPVVTTEEVEKMSLFDVFSNILLSSITMR